MKKIFKCLKKQKGQAIVELAITLPLLLLMLCGIIDFGWLFYNKISISNYTRESARYATIASNTVTSSGLSDAIKDRVDKIIPTDMVGKLDVDVVFSNPNNITKGDVTVIISYPMPALTPITMVLATDGKINVQSSVTMRME